MNKVERDSLIKQIADAAREPLPQIRPVIEIEGVDGNWYSPFGLPWQFKGTGRRRTVGFAYSDRNGTMYGRREASEQALIDGHHAREERKAAEFRGELAKMTDARLREQAAYWLASAA